MGQYLLGRHGQESPSVDFNRDIRPILNKNCTSCHGGVRQQGGVSFIYREAALGRGKSGRPTIVPGDPERSELLARVTSSDPEMRMPLHAPALQPAQIALLRQWIKEGARWENYWAFIPPVPQLLPTVKHLQWVRQPLDRFVLSQLEKESLLPAAEADKTALLRRVSFDLTGLPPTPDEIQAFISDTSPTAYEKQVDRLLGSPHYGERWAALWLDLARYADSKGFDVDRHHTVWPYRDWLIDALNRNVPYDQFVIKQLAGDLLPNATLEDHVATTFHRLTPTNDEGGTDDEEFRLVAVMDRVATTWSVLNGITMNCVQCHSHPYDPIRQVEYYESIAFFNTSRDSDFWDESPLLRVPNDKKQYSTAFQLQRQIASLCEKVVTLGRQYERELSHWESLPIAAASVNEPLGLERYLAELIGGYPLRGVVAVAFTTPKEERRIRAGAISTLKEELSRARSARPTASPFRVYDGQMEVVGNVPIVSVIELTAVPKSTILTALRLEVPPKNPDQVRHTPEEGFVVDRVDAWIIQSNGREERIKFRYFVPDSESDLQEQLSRARVGSAGAATADNGFARLDSAGGFAAYPKLHRTHWIVGIPAEPLRLPAGSRLKVQLTHTQPIAEKPSVVRRIHLWTSDDPRWMSLVHNSELSNSLMNLVEADRQLAAIPGAMIPVMVEQPPYERRETLLFERGNFLSKIGMALKPDVPAMLPKLIADAPRDRLALARWFFAKDQPLTARVAVNRYWEQLFGLGLVETLENFGSVGELPSHPELLDWLALHFQHDLRWDTKALLRELVTSATYRQSAKLSPKLREKDPRNHLLARGPHQRLTAEMVRDQALVASGLLNPKVGGPPVMPPQPQGIWMNVGNSAKWVDATGPDRYRRALYTFLKRSAIYPSFLIFDAATHDVSVARRIPTNTPLQALVTLNDPVYYEAAQALARQWLGNFEKQVGGGRGDLLDAQLNDGAWRVLSRDLTVNERNILRSLYEKTLAEARKEESEIRDSHRRSVLTSSNAVPDTGQEFTALTAAAGVLLNLDAAMTR